MNKDICREIAYSCDESGKVVRRDIELLLDNHIFGIIVATPTYIDNMRAYNANFSPDQQLEENFLPLEPLGNVQDICQTLHKMDIRHLKPYLIQTFFVK